MRASAKTNGDGVMCSTNSRLLLWMANTQEGYTVMEPLPLLEGLPRVQWLNARQTSKYRPGSRKVDVATNPRSCRRLCTIRFPICGAATLPVRYRATQRSTGERCDFSLFRLPSWNKLKSISVGSTTVTRTASTWSDMAQGGNKPGKRTSLHPWRTLQMSMQSK